MAFAPIIAGVGEVLQRSENRYGCSGDGGGSDIVSPSKESHVTPISLKIKPFFMRKPWAVRETSVHAEGTAEEFSAPFARLVEAFTLSLRRAWSACASVMPERVSAARGASQGDFGWNAQPHRIPIKANTASDK